LTRIEHRQAWLRAIRASHREAGKPQSEDIKVKPEAHHIIGVSQHYPINIPLFPQTSAGDLAIKINAVMHSLHLLDLITP